MTSTKVTLITVLWDAVAVVAAALLPGAVLSLPATRALLLPHRPLSATLHTLPLL